MLPETYPAEGKSEAEHDVFELLRAQLSPDWTCLHSIGLARHERKVWAEIDFVLIGPPGIFCLEVKGGHVARGDGVWIFRNRHGNENTKREGPFEQVGSAAGALRGFFRRERRETLNSIVSYGVVMPDVACTMRGPDVDPEVVVDQTTIGEGMRRYTERLVEIWTPRYRQQRGCDPSELSRRDRDDIVALMRGDFDLVPSLPTRIGWAERELIRLTEEQSELLRRLEENPRVLVRGAAGTGKTVIAVEEASRAARSGARVLFLCFNRLLASSLQKSAPEGVTVATLHSFMSKLIRDAGLDGELPDADADDLYEHFFPVLSLEALAKPAAPELFDMLVVDEGQDILLDNYLDVLEQLVAGGLRQGRWRIFYDPQQNIFQGIGGPAMERLLSLNPTRYTLTVNCRNTEQVATATAMYSGCEGLESPVQGPKVETLWYRDEPDQRRTATNCVGRLLSQGVRPADITVLATDSLNKSCLAAGWSSDIGARLADATSGPVHDDGAVRFSTIQAFKGLESDAVVLLDAVTATDASRYLTYVGASRARIVLVILLDTRQSEEIAARYARFGEAAAAKASLEGAAP
jgi:Nuclease-related domain/AAA domain/UvrD-like helicase C-terminal domain